MIALSTSFASGRFTEGEVLLAVLEGFDIGGIELEYRISEKIFHQMKPLLMRSRLQVTSVHNFFPIPGVMKTGTGGADLFLLSHPDREERLNAVKWTLRTIEHANELEAGVVILHCGRVEMDPGLDRLYELHRSGQIETEEAQALIERMMEYRDRKKPRHIEALLFSLDRLAREAERYDVTLALENRYHYHELPGSDDFIMLFNELDGAPLGYWHDTGHAHANECLSMGDQETLLNMNRDRLMGIHLHDAIGLDDHLPPGTGEIDFAKILADLNPDPVKVIELKPGTSDADIARGIEYIAKCTNS